MRSGASLVCEEPFARPVPHAPRGLRLLVAGCRLLTDGFGPVLDGYRGLAAFDVVHCGLDPDDLEGHAEEALGGLPPAAGEALRHADAVLLPPAVRPPAPIAVPVVRVELAPPCVVDLRTRRGRQPVDPRSSCRPTPSRVSSSPCCRGRLRTPSS
jgi:hypothetical protein